MTFSTKQLKKLIKADKKYWERQLTDAHRERLREWLHDDGGADLITFMDGLPDLEGSISLQLACDSYEEAIEAEFELKKLEELADVGERFQDLVRLSELIRL